MRQKKSAPVLAAAEGSVEGTPSVQDRAAMATRIGGAAAAFRMAARTTDLYSLLAIREVKEHEAYAALGLTWEQYCEQHLGRGRRAVDEDLINLDAFGEEFLRIAESLSLGRAAFRALRRLPEDAKPRLLESGNVIEVAGERIPLDADHRGQLIEFFDAITANQQELREKIDRGAEQVGELTGKIDQLTKENRRLKTPGELPEGITLFDRHMISIFQALKDAVRRINEEDPGTEPERVLKWIRKINPQWEHITRYATGYTPNPDAFRPEGMTAEMEADLDEILADE